MARNFDGTNDVLQQASAVVSGYPFSLSVWYNPDDFDAQGVPLEVDHSTEAARYIGIYVINPGGEVRAQSQNGGEFATAQTTAQLTTGTWHHLAAVFASATSRIIYIDGGNSVSNTTEVNFGTGINRTTIGAAENGGTQNNHADGQIAEAAVYDIALTAADVVVLSKAFSPLLVRRDALVSYWPIIGRTSPEVDIVGGLNMTVTEATVAPHPRIYYPAGPRIITPPAAAVGNPWHVYANQ